MGYDQRASIEGQTIQWPKDKEHTLVYKTLINNYRSNRTKLNTGINSYAPEGYAVPVLLVTSVTK